ncbi:LLM class F420-dependent oxidoreductase [Microbacterium neimengense]
MRMAPGDPLPGPTDAWTTLAGLARETSRIRLGTLVSSVTYRVPGVLAVQVAQVDDMSDGRVELGLGTGWFAEEHAAYGIPFPEKRFGLLEEQLGILTGMWQTPVGETFSFRGEHYRLDESPALPKPVQERVPVIVGGGGPRRTPAIAARYASEFNIGFATDEVIAEKFGTVRAACASIGRDPGSLKLSVALPTIVGRTAAEREGRAAAIGTDAAGFDNGANIIGDPAAVLERVERLRALGADRVYFQLMDMRDLEHLDLLGSEALPLLPR